MKPIEVKAHLNSMDGKMGLAILLGPNYLFARPITNSYVFKVGNQLCTGVMNWFVGEYYVDDKYGIVDERNENYDIYKKYINRTIMPVIIAYFLVFIQEASFLDIYFGICFTYIL